MRNGLRSLMYDSNDNYYPFMLNGTAFLEPYTQTPSSSRSLGALYVFNSTENLDDFLNKLPGAETKAVCSKSFVAEINSRSECTPLQCILQEQIVLLLCYRHPCRHLLQVHP